MWNDTKFVKIRTITLYFTISQFIVSVVAAYVNNHYPGGYKSCTFTAIWSMLLSISFSYMSYQKYFYSSPLGKGFLMGFTAMLSQLFFIISVIFLVIANEGFNNNTATAMGDKAMGAVTLFNSLIYLAWMLALNESRHEYEVLRPSAELIECVYNRSIQQMNDRFGRYKKLENINEVDNEGNTLVWIASKKGDREIVEFLCERGAFITITNKDGSNAFYIAAAYGHLDVVKYLKSRGANVNTVGPRKRTPVSIACMRGHLDVVTYLCDQGANIQIPDIEDKTPLLLASSSGRLDIVKFLHSRGADIDTADKLQGHTPLWAASITGNLDIVQFLYEHGANVNHVNRNGCSPLYSACEHGQFAVVQFLCEHGGNINLANYSRCTPLFAASRSGHYDTVQLLCKYGANIEGSVMRAQTPLWVASENGHTDIVRFLCEQGANVNIAVKPHGQTPMYIASSNGHFEIVKCLGRYGADINICNIDGRGPLDILTDRNDTQRKLEIDAASYRKNARFAIMVCLTMLPLRINYIMLSEGIPMEWPLRGEGGHILRYILNDGIIKEVCTFMS